MKIVLIGYMGSGKSSVAKHLATTLNFDKLDLDTVIEDSEGKPITEIFLESGEIYFRKQEGSLLKEIITTKNNIVLATGGGTPCYGNVMEFLKNQEDVLTVYLKVSVDLLTKRLTTEKEHRPIISHLKNGAQLNEFIRKHLFERAFYYNQALLRLNTDDYSEDEVVEQIVATLY